MRFGRWIKSCGGLSDEDGPQITSRKGAKAQNTIEKKRYSCRVVGGEVAEDLFNRGLCLPSGTAMMDDDLDRVIDTIARASRKGAKALRKRGTEVRSADYADYTD